jgi:hypothetical protein
LHSFISICKDQNIRIRWSSSPSMR